MEYSGVIDWSEKTDKQCNAGEVIKESDVYFRTHPKFRTNSEKYAWLNDVVAIGKMTSVKCGEGS